METKLDAPNRAHNRLHAWELQLASIVATAPETKKTKQKTGGRKKGTKNWTHPEIRDALLDKSGAISVLADFVAGRQLYAGQSGSVGKAGWRYPTLQQRLQALQILLAKVVPNLKATEISGPEGEALIPDPGEVDTGQLARTILSILSTAVPGGSVKFEKSDIG